MVRPNLGGVGYLAINAPSYAEQLLRHFNIKGDLPGELAARWDASVEIASLRDPENWWLRRGRRFADSVNSDASVGNFTLAELFLNTSVGAGRIMALVEELTIWNTSGTSQLYFIAIRPLPNLLAFARTQFGHLDDRQLASTASPVDEIPAYNLTSGAHATNGGCGPAQAWSILIPAGTSAQIRLPYVLTGRMLLRVATGVVNAPLGLSVQWRERAMIESER